MASGSSVAANTGRSGRPLPPILGRYTDFALKGLVVGTILALFALFTNPVPDPSFPWATLPAELRLPFEQPRIEHWPVTYTLGIWAWIVGFPALFLEGYRRYSDLSPLLWLGGLPIISMAAWTTYCRFFWPKLFPPTWNAPSYTVVCWLYCSTYTPFWSNLAYVIVVFGAVTALFAFKHNRLGAYGLGLFGILALPLGLPALFEAYRRFTTEGRVSASV